MKLLVRQIRAESLEVSSYELVDPSGAELPPFEAGSHLDVHLEGGIVRQYSLCGDPADRRRYVIAVRRDEAGRGGSRAVHDTWRVRHLVTVSEPRNLFPLAPAATRHVLLAGGIGITPLKAMVHTLAARGDRYELHYCARSAEHASFAEELVALGADEVTIHHDGGDVTSGGGLDIAALVQSRADAGGGTHLYFCGPPGFMAACVAASASWPAANVHSEHFAPPATTALAGEIDDAAGAFTVEIRSSGERFVVPPDESLARVLVAGGVSLETSCESGLCGTCKTRYLSGEVEHRDMLLSDEEREEHLTPCVSRARGLLVLDL